MLCSISIICLLVVSFTIFIDKRLRSHPQPLIAYICLFEAMMSWNALMAVLNPVYVSCKLGLNMLLMNTYTPFENPHDDVVISNVTSTPLWNNEVYNLNALCWSNQAFYLCFQTVSLLLNLCLCLDLILTLQSPFTPATSRVKWYFTFSILIPSLYYTYFFFHNEEESGYRCIERYYNPRTVDITDNEVEKIQTSGNWLTTMLLSLYIVVAFYSVFYSKRRLSRPGISKDVRQLTFRKHATYVIAFVVLWTMQQAQTYFTLLNPSLDPQTAKFQSYSQPDRLGVLLGFRHDYLAFKEALG